MTGQQHAACTCDPGLPLNVTNAQCPQHGILAYFAERDRERGATLIETVPSESRGVHESVLRAYQILEQVKRMVERGDSIDTIREFIRWAEA